MLELKKGIDILADIGGVRSPAEATKVFQGSLDAAQREKISLITTPGRPCPHRQRHFHVRPRRRCSWSTHRRRMRRPAASGAWTAGRNAPWP